MAYCPTCGVPLLHRVAVCAGSNERERRVPRVRRPRSHTSKRQPAAAARRLTPRLCCSATCRGAGAPRIASACLTLRCRRDSTRSLCEAWPRAACSLAALPTEARSQSVEPSCCVLDRSTSILLGQGVSVCCVLRGRCPAILLSEAGTCDLRFAQATFWSEQSAVDAVAVCSC